MKYSKYDIINSKLKNALVKFFNNFYSKYLDKNEFFF